MEQHEEIIVIVFSIIGFISIIIIICLIIWCIIRRRPKRIKQIKAPPIKRHERYQRSNKLPSNDLVNNKRKKKKKNRFNTIESTISLSYNTPHLINNNVKNLDQLNANESPFYYQRQQSLNNFNRCYSTPTSDHIYTSPSSLSTPLSNITVLYPSDSQSPYLSNFHCQSQQTHVNNALQLQQNEKRIISVKYSQSCRQPTDQLPFDYYRSITRSIDSNDENLVSSTYIRTNNLLNAGLIRKARLAQLRDDTAILY